MANWITHTRIADILISKGLDVDIKGFCIGNIAPDCNIENEDWTAYIPPKEVTHFMSKKENKTTSDYKGFYNTYIIDKTFKSKEEYSFLLGYYSHLITDAEYQRFIRDNDRLIGCFKRIKSNIEMYRKIEGYPETFDTLKKVFGKWNVFADIIELENKYLINNPNCSYNQVLRKTNNFPDYLDFLPENAVNRKLPIMIKEYDEWSSVKGSGFYFFSIEEYENYLCETTNIIYEQLCNKKIKNISDYLYHGSIIPNIKELETRSTLHNTNEQVLYLTSNIPYALVYIWDGKKNHSERKHVTCGIRNSEVFYEEKFPNQLETFYKGVSGYLYCVDMNDSYKVKDREYMYYSKINKTIIKTIFIQDVYEELLKYEALGEFKIYRYNEQSEEKKKELNELTAYYLIKNGMLKNDEEQANFYKMYYNTSWKLAVLNFDNIDFQTKIEQKYLVR